MKIMPDYTEERPWGSFITHDTKVKMIMDV